ncbi:MAG: porin family protein [Paludibacter sp.]|nr:porin family protein [Paludibacter sp.]
MRITQKVLLAVSFIFAISFSFAQAQIKIGAKAGLNLSTYMESQNGSGNQILLTGYNVGLISEITLKNNLFLQPGILFSTKGSNFNIADVSDQYITRNIEIPVNVLYKYNVQSVKLFGFAGPYIGLVVDGKGRTDNTTYYPIDFSSENRSMNSLDYGLNFGLGVEVSHFQISAQFGLGLANLYHTPATYTSYYNTYNIHPDDVIKQNRVIGISVGYLFGTNK